MCEEGCPSMQKNVGNVSDFVKCYFVSCASSRQKKVCPWDEATNKSTALTTWFMNTSERNLFVKQRFAVKLVFPSLLGCRGKSPNKWFLVSIIKQAGPGPHAVSKATIR